MLDPSSWHLCTSDYVFVLQVLPYFLAPQDVLGLSCIFPAPVLESTRSPRSPSSFYWKIVFRNQDLDSNILIQQALLIGPLNEQSKEIYESIVIFMCIHTCIYAWTHVYAHIYILIHICIHIYVYVHVYIWIRGINITSQVCVCVAMS